MTVAPSCSNTWGPTSYAAPLAQSSTIVSPSSGPGDEATRCLTYALTPAWLSPMRPTSEPVGRSHGSSRRFSICSSSSSSSLSPPRARNLMPLSGIGLWLAEIMTPMSASR